MDEPLSNLDAKLRVGMRAELSRLHTRLGITTVYVTHDQVEAMTLGERVSVMRDGRIQQVDEPQTLYHEPVNLFVAAFIGSPAMNLVDASIDGDEVELAGFRFPLAPERRPAYGSASRVILGIRPEDFEDAAFAPAHLPRLDVEVAVLEELGADAHIIFPLETPRVDVDELRAVTDEEDEAQLLADDRALLNARVHPETRARVGQRLTLAVNPARFHFFDPDTSESLLAGARAAA
jgi:multiple sugar transport system ATP-binding protein